MKSNRSREVSYFWLQVVLMMTHTNSQNVPMIQPISYSLPAPPVLMGSMSTNSVLTSAERVHENEIRGPTSIVSYNGHIYVTTVDSKIYDLASCHRRLVANLAPRGCYGKYACGQLISLRRDPTTGYLLALDTFRGLFIVNPTNGMSRLIFSSQTPVNGRRSRHLNDMVVLPNGLIVMTDSSDVYNVDNDVYICMDGRPTGRLLALNPRTGQANEMLPGRFNFPNGLERTTDGDLLVGETCRATIHRVSFKRNSWLQVSPFSVNLPGLPDNIRASGRDTYWVAMAYPRHSGIKNPVDQNSQIPDYRSMGFNWMRPKELRDLFTKWGIVVELDNTGAVIGSLHDPTGTTLSMITEVNESGGVLYFASHLANFTARFVLPTESGIKTSVDSLIQIKRSRCEIQDSQVAAVRRQLLQEQQTQSPIPK